MSGTTRTPRAAWRMLVLGVLAQASGSFVISVPAYFIPLLHSDHGMSLGQAGLLAATPSFGMVLTLVAWGAAADRWGERWVMSIGLALAAVFALVSARTVDLLPLGCALVLTGAAAAAANAASGRVVVGWFPRNRRGLAMGIRQMSVPLGVAVAALVVPPLAAHGGVGSPLVVAAGIVGVVAVVCAVGLRNPPRNSVVATSAATVMNPYRRSRFLLQIHAVSVLLVVPQFALSIFGLVWLIAGLGCSAVTAGIIVAAAQILGAVGRIGVGVMSDRIGSRVRAIRVVAYAGVAALLVLAGSAALGWSVVAVVAYVVATMISVADNGPAFTVVAEAAGSSWSGRALGLQNTGQNLTAALVGPMIGALITAVGYPSAFVIVATAPLLSLALIPRADEQA